MTTAIEFQAKVDKVGVDFDRIDQIVNGGPTVDVPIDNGLVVPSFAKLQTNAAINVTAALDAATAAQAAATAASNSASLIGQLAKAIPSKGNLPDGPTPNLLTGTATPTTDTVFTGAGCSRAVSVVAGAFALFLVPFGADIAQPGDTVAVSMLASKSSTSTWPTANRIQFTLYDADGAVQYVPFSGAYTEIDANHRRYHATAVVTLAKPAINVQILAGMDAGVAGTMRYTGFAATTSARAITDLDWRDWDPFDQDANGTAIAALQTKVAGQILAKAIPSKGNLPDGPTPNLLVGTAASLGEDLVFKGFGCVRCVVVLAGEFAVFLVPFGADKAIPGDTVAVSVLVSKHQGANWPTGANLRVALYDEDNVIQYVALADIYDEIDSSRRRYHTTAVVTLPKPALNVQFLCGLDAGNAGGLRYTGFAATTSARPITDLDWRDWDPFDQGATAERVAVLEAEGGSGSDDGVQPAAKAVPSKGNLPAGDTPNLLTGTATSTSDIVFTLAGCTRAVSAIAGEFAVFNVPLGQDAAAPGDTVAVSMLASKPSAAAWPTGNRIQVALYDADNAVQYVPFPAAFDEIDATHRRYHTTAVVTLAKPVVNVQFFAGMDTGAVGTMRYTGFAAATSARAITDVDWRDWDPFDQGATADRLRALEANGVLPGLALPFSIIGDSTVKGVTGQTPISMYLADDTGAVVTNLGVVGQTTPQIMARLGIVPILVTVTGDSIPANGAVTLTALNIAPINHTGPDFADTDGNHQLALRGWLQGVYGYLQRPIAGSAPDVPASSFNFIRFAGGAAVACPPGSVFTPQNDGFGLSGTIVVSMGYNNLTQFDRVTADFERLRDAMPAVFPRLVVLDIPIAQSDSTDRIKAIKRINTWLVDSAAAYGWVVLQVNQYISSLEALNDAGITPTTADLAAIDRGAIPPSLSADSGPHGTSKYNELVARRIADMLDARKWSGNAIPASNIYSFSGGAARIPSPYLTANRDMRIMAGQTVKTTLYFRQNGSPVVKTGQRYVWRIRKGEQILWEDDGIAVNDHVSIRLPGTSSIEYIDDGLEYEFFAPISDGMDFALAGAFSAVYRGPLVVADDGDSSGADLIEASLDTDGTVIFDFRIAGSSSGGGGGTGYVTLDQLETRDEAIEVEVDTLNAKINTNKVSADTQFAAINENLATLNAAAGGSSVTEITKVTALPGSPAANSVYLVKDGAKAAIWATGADSVPALVSATLVVSYAELLLLVPSAVLRRTIYCYDFGIGGSFWSSNGTTIDLVGTSTIASEALNTGKPRVTGVTTETIMKSILVPRKSMGLRRKLQIGIMGSTSSGNTNAKTFRIKFGTAAGVFGTDILTINVNNASHNSMRNETFIVNCGAANVQRAPSSAISVAGSNNGGMISAAIDTNNDAYINITGQVAVATETMDLEWFEVKLES